MITTKQQLNEYLAEEALIYEYTPLYNLPFYVTEYKVLYKHMKALREAEYAYNTNRFFKKLKLLKLLRIQTRYGMSIPLNTVGKGFHIQHLGSVIINAKAKVGENVNVHPGVCIGANHDLAPQIGNNVFIGPGAKVLGDISIADDVQIGANAVVLKSCDIKGAHLIGVPAKVIE